MNLPKAKWSEVFVSTGEWSATVGPYTLEVGRNLGRCEIWHQGHLTPIWSRAVPTPCDAADLMRITEAELARRLTAAAETMDGNELLGPSQAERFMTLPDGSTTSNDVFGHAQRPGSSSWFEKHLPQIVSEPTPFEVGDFVRERYDRRVAIVQKVVDGGACHLEFGYFHACALEPYTLPPITSYADLANTLDELPEGARVEVTSVRGTTLFKREARNNYRCRDHGDVVWRYATALTCLRDKLLPMPAGIRVLPPAPL